MDHQSVCRETSCGWICTEPVGHSGNHLAKDPWHHIMCSWPRTGATKAAPPPCTENSPAPVEDATGFAGVYEDESPVIRFTTEMIPQEKDIAVPSTIDTGTIRQFSSGATRDTSNNKPDYAGFYDPLVVKRFGEFMHKNRRQSDGSLRASDNWKKGIPKDVYLSSAFRHFVEWWEAHGEGKDTQEALCALLFNVQGYLYEDLREKKR